MASAKHTTTKKTSRKVKPVEDEERVDMVALVTSKGETVMVGRDNAELADKTEEERESCEMGWGAYNEEKKKNRKLEEQLKKVREDRDALAVKVNVTKEKYKLTMDKLKKVRLGKTKLVKALKKKGEQYQIYKKKNKELINTVIEILGENATKKNPDGSGMDYMESVIQKCLPNNMTPFGTIVNKPEYDFAASIRSYIYEKSPSSAQYWWKFGIATNPGLPTSGFINKPLANRNAKLNWKVSEPGKGRVVKEARGEWIYVPKFKHLKDEEGNPTIWNADKYGPIPQPGYGIGDDRPQGRRGGGGAATYERDE